jgi:hypothetical protein
MALISRLLSPKLRDDPDAFVMFAFPWGQKGTPLEHRRGPRKWQREVLQELREHIKNNNGQITPEALEVFYLSVVSGRGIGKSALVSWLVLWMVSTRLGSTAIVSANTEAQLRGVTWAEITKWLSMMIHSHWFELASTRVLPAKWIATLAEEELKIGTRYWGIEGRLWSEENPDGYAGVHNVLGVMLIFDEASGIADPIWAVARGFFTEPTPNRFWFAFSNGRRRSGYFFETHHSRSQFWRTKQIDARTVEDTDPKVYQQIIDEYGPESAQAHVEVYGMFPPSTDDQFISDYVVRQAMEREPYNDPYAQYVIGVDPARFGADFTSIVIRKGRDLVEIRRFKGEDSMEIAGRVIDAIREYDPILTVVDDGGAGAGVVDRLKELKYKIRPVNFSQRAMRQKEYANKRAEMWGRMRDWLKTASIPKDPRLHQQLVGPQLKFNSAGAMLLESKKDMKARGLPSPDDADAIAMTLAFDVPMSDSPIAKRGARGMMHMPSGSNAWLGN